MFVCLGCERVPIDGPPKPQQVTYNADWCINWYTAQYIWPTVCIYDWLDMNGHHRYVTLVCEYYLKLAVFLSHTYGCVVSERASERALKKAPLERCTKVNWSPPVDLFQGTAY